METHAVAVFFLLALCCVCRAARFIQGWPRSHRRLRLEGRHSGLSILKAVMTKRDCCEQYPMSPTSESASKPATNSRPMLRAWAGEGRYVPGNSFDVSRRRCCGLIRD